MNKQASIEDIDGTDYGRADDGEVKMTKKTHIGRLHAYKHFEVY
jgi:hypothetical protein